MNLCITCQCDHIERTIHEPRHEHLLCSFLHEDIISSMIRSDILKSSSRLELKHTDNWVIKYELLTNYFKLNWCSFLRPLFTRLSRMKASRVLLFSSTRSTIFKTTDLIMIKGYWNGITLNVLTFNDIRAQNEGIWKTIYSVLAAHQGFMLTGHGIYMLYKFPGDHYCDYYTPVWE